MSQIIGITGLAGSGKDTLAQFMQHAFRRYGEAAVLGGFADPIREICKETGFSPYDRELKEQPHVMRYDLYLDRLQRAIHVVLQFRISRADADTLFDLMVENTQQFVFGSPRSVHKFIEISPREFMQILGTEAGQTVRKSLWVDIAYSKWRELATTVLVTDFRFDHELKPLDRILVVHRPGITRVNQHVSEDLAERLTNTDQKEYLGKPLTRVANTGTLAHLQTTASLLATFPFSA